MIAPMRALRLYTNGKMLVFLSAFLIPAISPCWSAESQTYPGGFVVPLKDMVTKNDVMGVEVTTKSSATMTVAMEGNVLNVHVDGLADLADFQAKASDIVKTALNEDVECDHTLSFTDAKVVPYGCNQEGKCQSAQMTLRGMYQKLACLLGHERSMMNQDFTCTVLLTPVVVNNAMQFQTEVSDVTGSGMMGKLMGLEFLRSKIVEMINNQVQSASKSMQSTMALTFPPELTQYKPRLESVSFQSGEKGKLMMRVTGLAIVPQDKAQEALEALRQMIPAH